MSYKTRINGYTAILVVSGKLRYYEVFAKDAKSAKEMAVLNDKNDNPANHFEPGLPFEILEGVDLSVYNDIMENDENDSPIVEIGGILAEVE